MLTPHSTALPIVLYYISCMVCVLCLAGHQKIDVLGSGTNNCVHAHLSYMPTHDGYQNKGSGGDFIVGGPRMLESNHLLESNQYYDTVPPSMQNCPIRPCPNVRLFAKTFWGVAHVNTNYLAECRKLTIIS